MQLHRRSIHHDTSAPSGVVSSFLGVQPSCNAINSRANPALQASDRKKQAISSVGTQRKQGSSPGRICEVGPPASRCPYITSLIRAYGTQWESCSARPAATAAQSKRQETRLAKKRHEVAERGGDSAVA